MLRLHADRPGDGQNTLVVRVASGALVVLLAVLCALPIRAASPTASATQDGVRYEWQVEVQNSGVTDDLYAVAFANEQVGIAVGRNSTIIRTTDGGATWNRVMERRERGTEFNRVIFTRPTEGWVLGGTTLMHTDSAGERWRTVGLPERCSPRVQAITASGDTITINCLDLVYRSTDAGRTWTQLPGRLPNNDFKSMAVAGMSHAWLLRSQGEGARFSGLAMTTDGGATWQQLSLLGGGQIGFEKVQFVTPTVGWILPRRDVILATSDGGQTWDGYYTGAPSPVDFHFLNEAMGFLLAHGNNTVGEVFQSVDGGQSWTRIGVLSNPTFMRGLHSPHPEHVWTVGDRGYIAHLKYVPVQFDETTEPAEPVEDPDALFLGQHARNPWEAGGW